MGKHAYLIMCHDNFEGLVVLLKLLDDARNDIFIHVDKKAGKIRSQDITTVCTKAKVKLTKRISVFWGGDSQIKCELLLLKEATKSYHSYYHLLSGYDLPIKTQDYIHDYFSRNAGKEYVSVELSSDEGYDPYSRIGVYLFFQDRFRCICNDNNDQAYRYWKAQDKLSQVQRKIGINRMKSAPTIYKGSQWFSISHEFATYVLKCKKDICRLFYCGLCVDELFLQTVGMNSYFVDKIEKNNLRLIHWENGKPYVWKNEDFTTLMDSKELFARKIDYAIDPVITQKLMGQLLGKKF